MTAALARLDYHTADAAQAAIASLIASPAAATPGPGTGARTGRTGWPGNRARGRHEPRRRTVNRTARSDRRCRPACQMAEGQAATTSMDGGGPRCPARRGRHPHRRRGGARRQSPEPGRPCRQVAPRGLHRREQPAPLAVFGQRPPATPCRRAGPHPRAASDGTTRPAAPGERRQQDEDREQRLAALRIRLQKAAQDVRTAEDWVRCLRAAARLPAETWANILLISARIPAVTVVKGYEAWRAVGRQVNRDEKGIEIFSAAQPAERNVPTGRGADEPATAGATRTASHTSGICPRPAGSLFPPGPRSPRYQGKHRLACGMPCAGWPGERASRSSASPAARTTAPRCGPPAASASSPGLTSSQAIWALAHQLGHVLLHNTERPRARHHHNRLPGRAQSRSRLRRLHHLPPARRPYRARLRQPADLGRHRSAGPARRRHPGRRRAHHHGGGENQPPPGPPPARQHHRPGGTCPSRTAAPTAARRRARPAARTRPQDRSVLLDAGQFYIGQLAGSWAPAYLRQARHHRRGDGGVAHRIRPRRMDRAHQLPPRPRPPRRRDPGRRAGPNLLTRNAHRSLPGPGHAAGPRRAREPSPGSSAAPAPGPVPPYRNI